MWLHPSPLFLRGYRFFAIAQTGYEVKERGFLGQDLKNCLLLNLDDINLLYICRVWTRSMLTEVLVISHLWQKGREMLSNLICISSNVQFLGKMKIERDGRLLYHWLMYYTGCMLLLVGSITDSILNIPLNVRLFHLVQGKFVNWLLAQLPLRR